MNKIIKKIKENAGFTLVELIVVIAILAILAGVAVPAYSGYLKRANEAADSSVVSAVNTAIAAACTENGVDPASADDYIEITDTDATKAGDTLTVKVKTGVSAPEATKIVESFKVYNNNSTTFTLKYYITASVDTDGTLNLTAPTT